MDAYTSFSQVYDEFQDNIPYEEWAEYVAGILRSYGIMDGLVLDLGCGTGNMTQALARRGYDMIGVDNSCDMLEIAMKKKEASGLDILYLLQDMRYFELYGTVRAIICVCDSINYILSYAELVQVFRLVNNYLDPGGIFIFDLNTPYKYETILADNTFAEDREDASFIWSNFFDRDTGINEYDLTLFIREGELYRKYEESHFQRSYRPEDVLRALQEAGLGLNFVWGAFTREAPSDRSERLYIVAEEHGKLKE